MFGYTCPCPLIWMFCESSHIHGVAICLTKRFISYSGTPATAQLLPAADH